MYKGWDLVYWARKCLGMPYLYGGDCSVLTLSKLDYLRSMYHGSEEITDSRYNYAKAHYIGRAVTDCSGLIYGYFNKFRGSATLWDNAAKRVSLNLNQLNDIPAGAILYKSGHVGIYEGNGNVIEALGFDYGVCRNKVVNRNYTHYLLFDGWEYGGLDWHRLFGYTSLGVALFIVYKLFKVKKHD